MKLKTSKSAKKRIVKITKTGKVISRRLSAQHLVAGKTKRTKRATGKSFTIKKADAANLKKLVPYRVK